MCFTITKAREEALEYFPPDNLISVEVSLSLLFYKKGLK